VTPKPRAGLRTSATGRTISTVAAARLVLHIVDLDTTHGVQWPPLLQAIVERADPPEARFTGVGSDRYLLR
jgi:hypothetical protein